MRSSLATPSVRLHFFADHHAIKSAGCAYTAISLLTGEDPFVLSQSYRHKPLMTPEKMSLHLRQCGFQVNKLTPEFICDMQAMSKTIDNRHCIVSSIRLLPKESTWVVVYGGIIWHNFEMIQTSYTTALSWPPLTSFLVGRDEWGSCLYRKERTKKMTFAVDELDMIIDAAQKAKSNSVAAQSPTFSVDTGELWTTTNK